MLVAGLAATVLMLAHGTRGAEVANVLALLVAAAELLIAWVAPRQAQTVRASCNWLLVEILSFDVGNDVAATASMTEDIRFNLFV